MSNEPKKLITIHSIKGGVGKTSIALCIAALERQRKRRAILVDLDLTGTSLIALHESAKVDKMHDCAKTGPGTGASRYINEFLLSDRKSVV